MNGWPLQGRKIAVLVESEFIPGEIEAYRYGFGTLGKASGIKQRIIPTEWLMADG